MKILYKKKCLVKISSVEEFQFFVKKEKFYKHFIKFPEDSIITIKNKIESTEILNYKEVKKFIKEILKYPDSINNPLFLKCMGWDNDDIQKFIEKNQKNNSDKLRIKKKEHPELFFSSTTSRIEYWLSKGYTEEESKLLLSERQTTFSKNICIKKYGEYLGNLIFENRQKKWISSLKNNERYDEINKEKNSYKYDKKNFIELIDRTSFLEKTKNILLRNIEKENLDEFVISVLKEIDLKRYSDIHPFIISKIVQNKFKKTKEEIKKNFFNYINTSLSKQTYGVPVYHNGIRYKSIKEYEIALFFIQNNINFIYEKNYPNSNFKFDFYLVDKDVYIEYFGMLENKNIDKLDKNQIFYKEKMELKISFCKKNKLNLIYSVNYNELINLIKKII